MATMFDPYYATEVLNDILSRRGDEMLMSPKRETSTPKKFQANLTPYHTYPAQVGKEGQGI